MTVTANGDMVPCGEFIGLKEFAGGNIFETSISEAMNSESFKKIRARIVEEIPECSSCVLRNICGAPCPAELYALGNMHPVRSPLTQSAKGIPPFMRKSGITSNGMHQASVFCRFYKEIIKYAFKLIAEGKEKYCLRKEGFNNLEYEYCLE